MFFASESKSTSGRKPFHLFRGVNYSRNLRSSVLTGSKVMSRWVTKTKFGAKIWIDSPLIKSVHKSKELTIRPENGRCWYDYIMVLKLDIPFLYLKINKGDNLWFDCLWTLGGKGVGGVQIFMSLMCGHQKFFFLNWKLIVKNKSCWSQYTKICNMLVHFFYRLPQYLICEKNLLTKKKQQTILIENAWRPWTTWLSPVNKSSVPKII